MMTRKFAFVPLLLLFAAATSAQVSTWDFDLRHSNLGFKVKHLMISYVRGSFERFSGLVTYDEKDVTHSSVQVTIDVASISTANADRDKHLRSPDFFDAEKYPEMTFVSRRIDASDGHLKIIGDLTIKGTTEEVTLDVDGPTPPMTDPWGGTRMGATATTRINRTDFGLTWNQALETGGVVVGDDVFITLEVELVKK